MAMVLSELFMYYWLYRLYRAWELDVFRDRTFGVDVVASGSAANRYRPLAGWDDLYYEADEEDDK